VQFHRPEQQRQRIGLVVIGGMKAPHLHRGKGHKSAVVRISAFVLNAALSDVSTAPVGSI